MFRLRILALCQAVQGSTSKNHRYWEVHRKLGYAGEDGEVQDDRAVEYQDNPRKRHRRRRPVVDEDDSEGSDSDENGGGEYESHHERPRHMKQPPEERYGPGVDEPNQEMEDEGSQQYGGHFYHSKGHPRNIKRGHPSMLETDSRSEMDERMDERANSRSESEAGIGAEMEDGSESEMEARAGSAADWEDQLRPNGEMSAMQATEAMKAASETSKFGKTGSLTNGEPKYSRTRVDRCMVSVNDMFVTFQTVLGEYATTGQSTEIVTDNYPDRRVHLPRGTKFRVSWAEVVEKDSNNGGGEQFILNTLKRKAPQHPALESSSFLELAEKVLSDDSGDKDRSAGDSIDDNNAAADAQPREEPGVSEGETLEGLYHYGQYMYGVVQSGPNIETRGWVHRDNLMPENERVIVDVMRYLGAGRFRKANFVLKDEGGIFDVSSPVDIRQSYTCLDLMGYTPNQYVSVLVFDNSWVYLPLKEIGFFTRRSPRENREKGKLIQEPMIGWGGELEDYMCTMRNPAELLNTDPEHSMSKERLTMLQMDKYLENQCLRVRQTATPAVVSNFDWPVHKPFTAWVWDENSLTTPAMFMHGVHLLGARSDVFLVLDTARYGAQGDTGGVFEILSDNNINSFVQILDAAHGNWTQIHHSAFYNRTMDPFFYKQAHHQAANGTNPTLRREKDITTETKKAPMMQIAGVLIIIMLSFVCYFVVGRLRKKKTKSSGDSPRMRKEAITVPDGLGGGDTIEITLESGEQFDVEIPAGYVPGQTFTVEFFPPDPNEVSDTDDEKTTTTTTK